VPEDSLDRQAVDSVRSASSSSRAQRPAWRKVCLLLAINLVVFAALGLLAEVGFRLFWNSRYWISCERWVFGSGQTRAGFKWWPDTTYRNESTEFRIRFQTNALGYRARPEPPRTAHPYRIAFVGDSFTEAKQVEYGQTFCALIERGLAGALPGREVVCENYGVAATGLFDYWHRITHDVLQPEPPDVLVLCVYPGNDFSGDSGFPDAGFEAGGRPRREYYQEAGWARHVVTWLNLKSKFAQFLVRAARRVESRWVTPGLAQGPWLWWTDPALAARATDAPAVRRSRAVLRAIAEECRRHGTKLAVLVVGPVLLRSKAIGYAAKDGQSPLAQILADWQIDVPVVDSAIAAAAAPELHGLVFPRDGHLNPAGHVFVAAGAVPPLRTLMSSPPHSTALAPGDSLAR
jgi:hypothetical protein